MNPRILLRWQQDPQEYLLYTIEEETAHRDTWEEACLAWQALHEDAPSMAEMDAYHEWLAATGEED